MNSTIEYIRRLNQSSVALKDEWLSRLRTVDAGPNSGVATPEIILTTESSIKGFDEQEYETPVTIVRKPAHDEAGIAPRHETLAEHPAPVSLPETEEPVEISNDATPDRDESVINSESIPNASIVMEVHAASMRPSSDLSDIGFTTTSQSESTHSECRASDEQAPVAGTSQVLENTGMHDDIVRPAIMPLRPEQGPDALSGQSETEQHEPTIEITTSSIEDVIQRLEGTSGEASYRELEAAETGTSDTVDFDHDSDTFVDDGESSSSAAADTSDFVPAAIASYPTDRLGQRYIYAQSKKQILIDSVVDQIASRFPPATGATIMLVGTGREIDVDSAVSRVATCMAMRDMGNILLVDGNLPSRQMSSVLGLDKEAGVSELIRQQHNLSSMLCATDNSRLMILPAGRDQLAGAEIDLTAASLSNKSFKQHFAYTIIGGAKAGDSLTDSWASLVDGVYLLVDVDESDRETSREVVDYFRNMGARIVGCIATRS